MAAVPTSNESVGFLSIVTIQQRIGRAVIGLIRSP
jgi:hypothetical protein